MAFSCFLVGALHRVAYSSSYVALETTQTTTPFPHPNLLPARDICTYVHTYALTSHTSTHSIASTINTTRSQLGERDVTQTHPSPMNNHCTNPCYAEDDAGSVLHTIHRCSAAQRSDGAAGAAQHAHAMPCMYPFGDSWCGCTRSHGPTVHTRIHWSLKLRLSLGLLP